MNFKVLIIGMPKMTLGSGIQSMCIYELYGFCGLTMCEPCLHSQQHVGGSAIEDQLLS